MHRCVLAAIVSLALVGTAACLPTLSSEHADSGPVDRPFDSGGSVYMDLSAGQYVITGQDSRRLRVRWTADDENAAQQAKVVVDVKDKAARIATDGSPNDFRVEIDLPSRTDIVLRLSAGEVQISGVEGSKDISAWAGEVTVEVPDPAQYGKVSASLTAGEIRADAFGEKREGVFPAFDWKGKGPYELSTRLTAGQINYEQAAAAEEDEDKPAEPAAEKAPGGT